MFVCYSCHKEKPESEFGTKKNGDIYTNCLSCRNRRQLFYKKKLNLTNRIEKVLDNLKLTYFKSSHYLVPINNTCIQFFGKDFYEGKLAIPKKTNFLGISYLCNSRKIRSIICNFFRDIRPISVLVRLHINTAEFLEIVDGEHIETDLSPETKESDVYKFYQKFLPN